MKSLRKILEEMRDPIIEFGNLASGMDDNKMLKLVGIMEENGILEKLKDLISKERQHLVEPEIIKELFKSICKVLKEN